MQFLLENDMSAVPGVDHCADVPSLKVPETDGQPRSSSTPPLRFRVHEWLVSWHRKRESRKALLHLTDAELLDIGVTRSEARIESGKSFFWD
jgi:uncharacterized protein YjiS (DUF1127 family)